MNDTFLIIKAIKVSTACIAAPIFVAILALSLMRNNQRNSFMFTFIGGIMFTIAIYVHFWWMGL